VSQMLHGVPMASRWRADTIAPPQWRSVLKAKRTLHRTDGGKQTSGDMGFREIWSGKPA